MDLLHNITSGFGVALTLQNSSTAPSGVFFGQMVGVLPGIGAPTAIALLPSPHLHHESHNRDHHARRASTMEWHTAGPSRRC